jgi:phage terminase large subunit-like protein
LIADPTTVITRGSTYDNRANLAPAFLAQIIKKYEGTRLGRQELNAEVLDDVPGALWNRARLEELRWPVYRSVPELTRIVVAIDPAASSGEDADETGIIVAGRDAGGRGYVLADRSGHYTPTEWAQAAIALYRQHKADRIVAEVNNGGDMVEATLRMVDANVPFTAVHASRGKSCAPSLSRRSMSSSRAASFMSARSRPLKIRCAPSRRTSIEPRPASRRTASMHRSGRSAN